jgi:hypothetical protein
MLLRGTSGVALNSGQRGACCKCENVGAAILLHYCTLPAAVRRSSLVQQAYMPG